jgi:hypothetical protein
MPPATVTRASLQAVGLSVDQFPQQFAEEVLTVVTLAVSAKQALGAHSEVRAAATAAVASAGSTRQRAVLVWALLSLAATWDADSILAVMGSVTLEPIWRC